MLLRRHRAPNVERLRRKENTQGLQAALAYSDRIVDRNGAVLDQGVQVRVEAVNALAEIEEGRGASSEKSEIVPLLAGALGDEFEIVGRTAAQALGRLGTPAAVDALLDFLASEGANAPLDIRRAAIDGVAASRQQGLAERWARKVLDARTAPLDALDRGELAILMGADSDPDPRRRLFALLIPRLEPDQPGVETPRPPEQILSWHMPAEVEELDALLRSPVVPEAAVRLAGESGSQALLEPLVALLESESDPIRREAVTALGELYDTTAVLPLLMASTDPDVLVRRGAVRALDMLGSAGVTAAMALLAAPADQPQVAAGAEPPPPVPGERWMRTLERLAERTGLGRGQRRSNAKASQNAELLIEARTRYETLLRSSDPIEDGDL